MAPLQPLPPRSPPDMSEAIAERSPLRRRLADKVTDAFHAACDEGAIDTAWQLLGLLERLSKHPPMLPAGRDRRKPQNLVGAHERIWNLPA